MIFPEKYRAANIAPPYNSNPGDPYGIFLIPSQKILVDRKVVNTRRMKAMACEGNDSGWEHVSVSIDGSNMPPSWTEMCIVKDLFWEKNEAVIQIHPAQDEYVNNHPGCLHLWRPVNSVLPLPPSILV